jgi:hypothetical protein
MQNQPEMAKATFYVKSDGNGGFSVASTSKGFRIGGQNMERNSESQAKGEVLLYMSIVLAA